MKLFTAGLKKDLLQDDTLRFYIHFYEVVNLLNQLLFSTSPPSDEMTLFHNVASVIAFYSINMGSRLLDLPKNLVSSLYFLDLLNSPRLENYLKYEVGHFKYFGWGQVSEENFENMLKTWHALHAERVRLNIYH